jgi:hypothetical protein
LHLCTFTPLRIYAFTHLHRRTASEPTVLTAFLLAQCSEVRALARSSPSRSYILSFVAPTANLTPLLVFLSSCLLVLRSLRLL